MGQSATGGWVRVQAVDPRIMAIGRSGEDVEEMTTAGIIVGVVLGLVGYVFIATVAARLVFRWHRVYHHRSGGKEVEWGFHARDFYGKNGWGVRDCTNSSIACGVFWPLAIAGTIVFALGFCAYMAATFGPVRLATRITAGDSHSVRRQHDADSRDQRIAELEKELGL